MAEEQKGINQIVKLLGIAAVTVGLSHIIKQLTSASKPRKTKDKPVDHRFVQPSFPSQAFLPPSELDDKLWSQIKLDKIDEDDGLLRELEMMTLTICPFQRVSNLIVDLQMHNPQTFPCPLLAKKPKKHKDQPFIHPDMLVKPGQFVIQNCVFRSGQSIQIQKKFMKAGPRSTQFFSVSQVRADIVVCGKSAPGISNIIKQLVVFLKQTYKIEKVTGARFSWQAYSTNNFIDLSPKLVEKIHHKGGSYLGTNPGSKCNPKVIVDSLEARNVNQLYMIGGNNTIADAIEICKQIRSRRLAIATCVCLKAINKDISYFDNCFGFESAVQQTQRFIEQGYAIASTNYNSVVMVKVPGRYSGFLAVDAVCAARNANICLVPQFQYDLYGQKGLLQHIANRVQSKGYCIMVYSQGSSHKFNDIPSEQYTALLNQKETKSQYAFDLFLRAEIQKALANRKLSPSGVYFFDTCNAVRTVTANSFDTKLCRPFQEQRSDGTISPNEFYRQVLPQSLRRKLATITCHNKPAFVSESH